MDTGGKSSGMTVNNWAKDWEKRFWSNVIKGGDCWLWTGTVSREKVGYGQIMVNYKRKLAHRLSWEMHKGPLQENQCVLHRCDVSLCVNPDHLFIGGHSENIADKTAKGRQSMGTDRWNAIFSEEDIRRIRKLCDEGPRGTQKRLAVEYKTSPAVINLIAKRKSWKHVS